LLQQYTRVLLLLQLLVPQHVLLRLVPKWPLHRCRILPSQLLLLRPLLLLYLRHLLLLPVLRQRHHACGAAYCTDATGGEVPMA
jgi:hypothetical protein